MKTQYDEERMWPDERKAIDAAATDLLTHGDCTRSEAAAIIRRYRLIPFIGGHHVAIHAQRPGPVISGRLAMVTSDTPDWQ